MKQFDKKITKKVFTPRNHAKKNLKGFTILEMIVAIFLITVGIIGIFALITKTVSNSTVSRDEMTAAYLAQEGIEIVRNIRDSNYINGQGWDETLDVTDDPLSRCPNGYKASYSSQALDCYSEGDYLQLGEDGFYY